MRIYVDTSVFGGIFDDEFIKPSTELFDQIRQGLFSLCISEVVIREIANAPDRVSSFFKEILPLAQILPITKDCIDH